MNEQIVSEMVSSSDFTKGAAYSNGEYVPIGEATISVLDWGFNKSDVTYDVVHVSGGAFFRLDRHLDRFSRSMERLRMTIPYDRDAMTEILMNCVRLTGLREAYVAMLTTRGVPLPGLPRLPSLLTNRFHAYAIPWVDVIPPEVQERGAHLIIAKSQRIPPESVDPTVKNYHWGDMIQALFEVEDAGADNAVLLDRDGFVTEGPGFNVFMVRDGKVISPDRGALEGITRGTVFDLCDALDIAFEIRPITADELRGADEIFTTTTAGGIMPAARIDGTILTNDRPGPISIRLKDMYWQWHREGRDATPVDYG